MKVRVIIPTNEKRGNKFDRCIGSLMDITDCVADSINGDAGFTQAINQGIEKFFDHSVKFLWILNDDTIVLSDTLEKALEFMENHPKCGIMGFQNLKMDDQDKIIWGGSRACFPAGVHKTGRVSMGDLREPTKEKWVTFSSALVRKEVIRQLGYLDPNMVWVYSDSDYCYRARSYGWECWYNPDAKILHETGVSANPSQNLLTRFRLDQIAFANKWLSNKIWIDLDSETF